jgi:hypothetical protein
MTKLLGLGRNTDVLLALLVAGLVALLIVPLPTPLLDVLLAGNIAMSIVLLLVSMYVADAVSFASFPTLLLVTTLFRLALNVSSTRLILLQADAGEVIRAFGRLRGAGQLRGGRGGLPDPHAHPVHGHRSGRRAGGRGGSALHVGRHARQADGHRRRAAHRRHLPGRGAPTTQDHQPASRSSTARWTAP